VTFPTPTFPWLSGNAGFLWASLRRSRDSSLLLNTQKDPFVIRSFRRSPFFLDATSPLPLSIVSFVFGAQTGFVSSFGSSDCAALGLKYVGDTFPPPPEVSRGIEDTSFFF